MSDSFHFGYAILPSGKRKRYQFGTQAAMAKAEIDRGEAFISTGATTDGETHRRWLEATKAKLLANGYVKGSGKAKAIDPKGVKAKAKAGATASARTTRIAKAKAKAKANQR